jgi:prepilin-type N-terminal cleavage/methylation domain-containing protein/prepilin-type processing-associated H-X9-DG protein
MSRRWRIRAFTLIELLVVIAIIAILAAILFPVFAQAREKARGITCTSNMKEIGLAWTMYIQDYDETFPETAFYDAPKGAQIYWLTVIDPYVKGGVRAQSNGQTSVGDRLSIYVCPDYDVPAPNPDEAGTAVPGGLTVGRYPLTSYSPNYEITTAWWDSKAVGTLAAVAEPANIVMLAENHDCCVETTGGSNWQRAAGRHSGGSNYVEVDGHVKWFKGPVPRYAKDAKGEPVGTSVCLNKNNKTGCSIYFRPRGG